MRPAVAWCRSLLDRIIGARPELGRVASLVGRELVNSVERSDAKRFYEASYFGDGRDPCGDREGRSGYATYDRVTSNADVAGFLLWRTFGGAKRTLDIGCASGFLVEVLRELGVDAEGCDVSRFAIANAASELQPHIRVADLMTGLPWADASFDVVSVLETLEHLPPGQVAQAIAELCRVCGGFVYATIPSFGPNDGPGPDGFFDNKVRAECLDDYRAAAESFDGPVPYEDLARDVEDAPVEGHLTIASYRWWTRQFESAGMIRRPDIEARIHADIEPAGLAPWWNLYVFAVPDARDELAAAREPERDLVSLGLRHPLYAT